MRMHFGYRESNTSVTGCLKVHYSTYMIVELLGLMSLAPIPTFLTPLQPNPTHPPPDAKYGRQHRIGRFEPDVIES
jgi:hypothetical protein